jgi:DNA-binding response OmpR family regulator
MAEAAPRILIVDDDPSIRELLTVALADEGYATRGAADGRAALATLDNWLADLVILDLMMPDLDGRGFRAAQRGRPALAAVPVIVLSAAHDAHEQAITLEAAAVVPKPFDLDALLEVVARLLPLT